MKKLFLPFLLLPFISCQTNTVQPVAQEEVIPTPNKAAQDSLIEEYITGEDSKTSKLGLFSPDRQAALDEALSKDSTIAYFWQQKAMPLFKQGKHELALPFIDKAVKYDRKQYQSYRAFMKCIFVKQYRDAIVDFEDCKERYGNLLVMDHSYDFYIALSYLQLNEFALAEEILVKDIAAFEKSQGKDFIHALDLFYLGIARYEQKKYASAITALDTCLAKYPTFAEALYYKALSHFKSDDATTAKEIYAEAVKNGKAGYTINEDNALYERYPYQRIVW